MFELAGLIYRHSHLRECNCFGNVIDLFHVPQSDISKGKKKEKKRKKKKHLYKTNAAMTARPGPGLCCGQKEVSLQ